MGYLFLAVSLLAGVTKGFCGKKTGSCTEGFRSAVTVNVIRMLLCVGMGFFFVLFGGGVITLKPVSGMLLFSALAGVSTALFAVTWLLSVRVGAYMLVDVSLMCGVLVPVLGSFIFLDEGLSWRDLVGLALLLGAVCCMCLYNNRTKAKLTVVSVILLLLCGLSSGLSDFSQKLYVANGGEAIAAFSFYTYVFAALALLLFYGILACRSSRTQKEASLPLGRVFPLISVMALCMFAASFFQTLAAQHLPASELYPLARGIALILSAVMSWIFFGEKPTAGSILGMVLAFAALLLINL